jgi:hypothetical protein
MPFVINFSSNIESISIIDGRLLLRSWKSIYSINFDQVQKFSVVVVPERKKLPIFEKITKSSIKLDFQFLKLRRASVFV